MKQKDKDIMRGLAERYRDIAELPVQEEKKRLWRDHLSLKPTRIPILATYGMWNVWCDQLWGKGTMECESPFLQQYERALRLQIFNHEEVGDDLIQHSWLTMRASVKGVWGGCWGVNEAMHASDMEGGAASFDPPLTNWDDMEKLTWTPHEIDEKDTARNLEVLSEAVGDILPIDVSRTPVLNGAAGDISTSLAKLRGLETLMMDMYEYPEELHRLLAFMRDGILANNQTAEEAGDYSMTSGLNQAECYTDSLEDPCPNSGPRKRKDLFGFVAAQEYTLISPAFHEEFMAQYQRPIMEHFGLIHYGCCEDLTRKIDMLRTFTNLRSIAVAPTANVAKCAEQIGQDYVISWRPNPADMVCCGYNEDLVTRIVSEAIEACRGCFPHIHLKDVETLEGDNTRLKRWVQLVRSITEKF